MSNLLSHKHILKEVGCERMDEEFSLGHPVSEGDLQECWGVTLHWGL